MTLVRVLASHLAAEAAAQLWAQLWAGWAVGTGTVPCSPCSLRAAGDPVSPMATLSESEVCFSWDSLCGRAEPHQHHPPATASPCTGLGDPAPLPLPSENGKGSLCSPRNLGSSSPVLSRFVHSSPTQPLRNHHLVQLHLARQHWGGGGFHPACCWTAGFLYHLQRQPQLSLQSDPRARAPSLAQLLHCQSQAEPGGQVLVPTAQGSKPTSGLLTHWPLQNFNQSCGFCRGFWKSQKGEAEVPSQHHPASTGHLMISCFKSWHVLGV